MGPDHFFQDTLSEAPNKICALFFVEMAGQFDGIVRRGKGRRLWQCMLFNCLSGTCLSSILVVEPSKLRSFPIKTRGIWVPGRHCFFFKSPKYCSCNPFVAISTYDWRNLLRWLEPGFDPGSRRRKSIAKEEVGAYIMYIKLEVGNLGVTRFKKVYMYWDSCELSIAMLLVFIYFVT